MPALKPYRMAEGGLPPAAVLALGLGALLIFRLAALRLNATDLFFDEAQYWSWSREPAFGYYSKPPLIAWIIALATSVCGDTTACIRAPAPILHTATSIIVFLIGCRLYDPRVGLWSALAFATLPGVTLSSGIISTDVPLLLCWAVAVWAYVVLKQEPGWTAVVWLGLALGAGLNAKYAMAFVVLCIAVHMAVTPAARRLLADGRLWTGLAIGAALILPNLAWNVANGWPTLAHTADNAKWGGALVNVGKGFEFLAAQLAVFGPILFIALLVVVHRVWRDGLPEPDRLLLAFTLPVLLLISAQAFISRAHANWAAVSYVGGTLLVTAALLRADRRQWLSASLALHGAVVLLLAAGTSMAGRFTAPLVGDPFQRTLGWREVAGLAQAEIRIAEAKGQPFRALMTDDRSVTAELLYYLRNEATPVLAWREAGRPRDHYEMTRPFRDRAQVPVLLLSVRQDASAITGRFSKVETLGVRSVPAGRGTPRQVRLFSLSGFKQD